MIWDYARESHIVVENDKALLISTTWIGSKTRSRHFLNSISFFRLSSWSFSCRYSSISCIVIKKTDHQKPTPNLSISRRPWWMSLHLQAVSYTWWQQDQGLEWRRALVKPKRSQWPISINQVRLNYRCTYWNVSDWFFFQPFSQRCWLFQMLTTVVGFGKLFWHLYWRTSCSSLVPSLKELSI